MLNPCRASTLPLRSLLVKSEYLLQSVLKYPLSSHCPHCGSARQTQIARKYGVARIVRCVDCGAVVENEQEAEQHGWRFFSDELGQFQPHCALCSAERR